METKYYNSRVDWWIYAIVLITLAYCIGMGIFLDSYAILVPLAVVFGGIEIVMFCSVKYAIRGNELGIRETFFRWKWYPINKISEARLHTGILAASALSARRVAIKFSDPTILKSYCPLEISPKNREAFIADLLAVNPDIKY